MNPIKLLEECEVLVFLGEFSAAAGLLRRIPSEGMRQPRAIAARLRIAAGLGEWEAGFGVASKVGRTADFALRHAAGEFLYKRAEVLLKKGKVRTAIDSLKMIPHVWPEGNVANREAA